MAFDESLNTRHIATNLENYEAARTGFFTLIVHDLDNLLKINYKGEVADAGDSDYIQHAQDYLRLNVTKCDIPSFDIATMEYRRGNDVVKFAGVPTFKDGSITVDDVVGLDTKSILYAWRNLAYNPHTRKGGRMKDYKKHCTLIEYTQDYEQVRSWELEGCFITSLTEEAFDRESDNKRTIGATIIYDRAVMVLPEEENI